MCGQKAAKRRRRQAVKEYRHVAAMGRPKYKKSDAAASARKLRKKIDTERRIAQKGK